jgi:Na+-driven multidrug efflux pump
MVIKKGDKISGDNSSGVVGVILGILSIILLSGTGIFLGVIGLIFSMKQNKVNRNKWTRAGITLNVIGIILGIIAIVLVAVYADQISQIMAQGVN